MPTSTAREARLIAAAFLFINLATLVLAVPGMEILGSRRCAYAARTGHACLGCGGTRAFILAVHGHLGAALAENPLGAYAASLLLIGLPWGVLAVVSGRLQPLLTVLAVLIALLPGVFAWNALIWWWNLQQPLRGVAKAVAR